MIDPVDEKTLRQTLGFQVADVFVSHLECADIAQREQLLGRIDGYVEELQAAGAGGTVNLARARQIAGRCSHLLTCCDPEDAEQMRLVVAAVRYFLDPDDIETDDESLAGFEDDARVVNAVIRWTGLPVPELDQR